MKYIIFVHSKHEQGIDCPLASLSSKKFNRNQISEILHNLNTKHRQNASDNGNIIYGCLTAPECTSAKQIYQRADKYFNQPIHLSPETKFANHELNQIK